MNRFVLADNTVDERWFDACPTRVTAFGVIVTATEAMFQKAAMLPSVELMRPDRAIGTNTIDAMKSGIVFGYVGLVEGMVARIQGELGTKTKVIATGGHAHLIAGETKVIDEVSPDLTLIGLKLIYWMNNS